MNKNENEKNSFHKGLLIGIICTIICFTVLSFAFVFFRSYYNILKNTKQTSAKAATDETTSITEDHIQDKMKVLQGTIDQYYLEDTETSTLEEGVYRGMLESLGDPYSVYYTSEELKELQQDTEGIYYGVGAYVGMDLDSGYAQFSKVMKNTPAEAAGFLDGDYIYKVDGEDMQGKELSYVVSKIKGEEGSKVTITIIREGQAEPMEIVVERRKIESPTVNYEMYDNKIAYIQITEFDNVTEEQFANAYEQAKAEDMKGLILDLRSNPGGNLVTVVEIARKLLPKGMIVYTEDKYGKKDEYKCDGKNQIDVPLVVLVNGYSASASEILAGAIKDYGIGTLIGTTTYGKGIVQKVISLSDGSAVKLTVSKYYTPNGNNIHKIGIEPDVEIAFDVEKYQKNKYDNQLEEAKEIIGQKIEEQK